MRKLFAALLVAVVYVFSGTTYAAEVYTVKAGDTLGKIAGKNWRAVCKANNLEGNCNLIHVGQKLKLDVTSAKLPKTHLETASAKTCIMLGAAPFNPEHKIARTLQGIELMTTLSPEQKAIAKRKVVFGEKATSDELVGQQIFKEMLYKSKATKKVVHIYDKLICNPETGGIPEVMDTYALGGGVFFSNPRRCGNPSTFSIPVVNPPVVEPPKEEVPPPVVEPPKELPSPPPVVSSPPPPAEKIACDEWDVHASAGVELSKGADTRSLAGYLEGEVGACPFKWEGKDGVFNEMLIAGRYHETNDNWREWDGKNRTALLGVGLRRTDKDGSVDMYRLMAGSRMNDGSQGLYAQSARWNVVGLYGTHYRVEDDGTNETHYRWGILAPFGDAKGSASWAGSPLPLPSYNGSLEAGIRRYFTKQGEDWRLFGEINATVVSPDYAGIGPRIGVCNERDTLCVLGGVNIDVQNGGTAAMVGVQINTPGVIRMNRDGVIMKQTVEAATVNGISFQFAPAQRASPQSD